MLTLSHFDALRLHCFCPVLGMDEGAGPFDYTIPPIFCSLFKIPWFIVVMRIAECHESSLQLLRNDSLGNQIWGHVPNLLFFSCPNFWHLLYARRERRNSMLLSVSWSDVEFNSCWPLVMKFFFQIIIICSEIFNLQDALQGQQK